MTAIDANLKSELSVHFFTIVLNGQPYIPYHIEIFKRLPFVWHWHIIEGVADLKHDTGWSVELGGAIGEDIHRHGLSNDGTTEYLDELAKSYPDDVTIYRKSVGVFWDGKREMVNAPLENIRSACLLWQVDVDELWTVAQLCTGRQLFVDNPTKTAAFYWCWYFVGENLLIGTRNCYTQNPQQEWLRTWRFKPGAFWQAHEPPVLVQPTENGEYINVAEIDPIRHRETEQLGLIFQHFAYATEAQLLFKERYYGYQGAVVQWQKLQETTKFPIFLRDYFDWVKDGTQVDLAQSRRVIPIARREPQTDRWHFLDPEHKPTVIVDGVFFQMGSTGIARVWQNLLQEWVKMNFAQHVILLDRGGTAPQIPGLNSVAIDFYNPDNPVADSFMLQEICDRYQADLFMSTYYTQPISTLSILLVHDMIPEAIGTDLSQPMWQEKNYAISHAARYIAISEHTSRDICRFYPQIDPDTITVALNGVDPLFVLSTTLEIAEFRTTHQITRPYFTIVGDRIGLDSYKNAIHAFRAFAQLPDREQYEIVCVGGNPQLEPELTSLVPGMKVHRLSLRDRELQAAYTGAVALIYPSYYEGFGLPILEAMACGCPVITCRNSAIPEVGGDAAIYVSETNIKDLIAALDLVQQPDVRARSIAAGLERARHFSWTKMADTIAKLLIVTHTDIQSGKFRPLIKLEWAQFRQAQCLSEYQQRWAASQTQLLAAQSQIVSMESTKFWQLRQRWFELKKWLRLVDDSK